MFEDALMESGGKIKSKSKYWSIAAFAINAGILIALILYPLFHLESLPKQMMATLLTAPAPPPPPPPPPPPAAPVPKVHVQTVDPFQAPSKIPHEIKVVKEEPPPPPPGGVAGMEGMAGGSGGGAIGGILGGMGPSAPVVKAAAPKKIAISSGVMAGNKLSGTNPTYPPIARAARISGTVVLQATISKSGSIENLRVVSGPPMLTQSALDAVRTWRYKPYQLNGEPVEVETTVNVVFNLGG